MLPFIRTTDASKAQYECTVLCTMLGCFLMDPGTDVCQTEQPQISYSVDFAAEQSTALKDLSR